MKAAIRTVIIIVVLFVLIFTGAYFAGKVQETPEDPDTQQEEEIKLKANQAPEGTIKQQDKPQDNENVAVITTDKGEIIARLFPEGAPETVKNFKALAADGKYEDVQFHRVMKDFMIQTGDFENNNGTGGFSYKGKKNPIENEIHPDLTHIEGALSMANSGPDTNGSQFFIVDAQDGADFLDNNYTVFGQVVSGQDVVRKIASVKTKDNGQGEKSAPVEPVLMKSVTIKKYGQAK